jgi:hypothetical protein
MVATSKQGKDLAKEWIGSIGKATDQWRKLRWKYVLLDFRNGPGTRFRLKHTLNNCVVTSEKEFNSPCTLDNEIPR